MPETQQNETPKFVPPHDEGTLYLRTFQPAIGNGSERGGEPETEQVSTEQKADAVPLDTVSTDEDF